MRYTVELSAQQVTGELYSAMHPDQLPAPADRPAFTETVRALLHADQVSEQVDVIALLARTT